MTPDRWTARCKGASFCNAKCVQIAIYCALVAVLVKPLGWYMMRVYL